MQRFFRTRLGAFVLFLIFIVLSQLIEWGLGTLALRLHLVDISDRTWRPSLFIAFEGVTALAALGASFAIVAIGRRSMRELGYAGNGAGKLIVAGSARGAAAPMLLIAAIVALGGFTFGAFAMHGTQLAAYTLAWLVAMFGIGLAEGVTFRRPAFLFLGGTNRFLASAGVSPARQSACGLPRSSHRRSSRRSTISASQARTSRTRSASASSASSWPSPSSAPAASGSRSASTLSSTTSRSTSSARRTAATTPASRSRRASSPAAITGQRG